ncbi:hypothetical protein OSB04_028623 [Centaurea solstitialis]|uniref:Uncharacterized protein n=1 Tax=Centaurea solstitialis TaxID=347529 RepID=A0AA38W0T3_9ASTR|nr:hypothetical protein OSB04_028623 [Centaurea solstitialis]
MERKMRGNGEKVPDEVFDPYEEYEHLPTFISIRLHHGGIFSKGRSRKYLNVIYSRAMNLCVLLRNLVTQMNRKDFFHFVRPDIDLQFGLQALGNDTDIQVLLEYVPECKLFDVYTEH